MFSLKSPSSLMSPESIPSAMPPPSPKRMTNSDGQIDFGRDVEEEEEEEEKEVWSGDSEEEQESTNILDPKDIRRKGRPPSKMKQGGVEKIVKKKREREKKTLSNEKAKEVEEIAVDHVVGTQESVVNVNVRNFMLPKLHGTINVAKHDAPYYATKYGTRRKHPPIFSKFIPIRNRL
ncbi:hypothetical protein RHGRI_008023 [Rhododendron griersonianum]|uniref:Uncharacterized protein n=1 Tax=Rhododendron griersonianum TaxID=479676 RepID=A0AAV6L0D1_9ERIC|nr:hypothetical protein RHGRI_008023 [Rhododendron griersonianum]